jgi:hypothetical protein
MPANTSPIFTWVPNCQVSTITAANTARDGSGSLVTAFTAGSNGSLLSTITFTNNAAAVGASVLKVVRVFVTDASGATPTMLQEALMPLITSSNTVIGATITITFTNGLILKSGQIIKVAQSLCATSADNSAVVAQGGDY